MFVLRCTKKLLNRLRFVSEKTLLPVVVSLAPSSSLTQRFVEALRDVLAAIGVPHRQAVAELGEMKE